MKDTKDISVVYFDRINGVSACWAAFYVLRGWKVYYFDQTLAGRAAFFILRLLVGHGGLPKPVDYQVGDHLGLAGEGTRFAVDLTESWFSVARGATGDRIFENHGPGERWVSTYVKKSVMLTIRRLVLRIGVVDRVSRVEGSRTRVVHSGSWLTRMCVDAYVREYGPLFDTRSYPSLPVRLGLAMSLVRYVLALIAFVARRRVELRVSTKSYLLAKRAMMPVGKPRGDDTLVDGTLIKRDDLLIFHSALQRKPHVREAVSAAREAGYDTVDLSRVPVSLAWLLDPATVSTYWLKPLVRSLVSLVSPDWHASACSGMLLRMRRVSLGWEAFFEKYAVKCILEGGYFEDQVVAAMSADMHGCVSIALQASEIFDPLNEDQYYLAHHLNFVWGPGLKELWTPRWSADQIVLAGYTWGGMHVDNSAYRDEIRAEYGVTGEKLLVAVFDTSIGRDSFNSPGMLRRFYSALPTLAHTLENAVIVVKPKDMGSKPVFDAALGDERIPENLHWADVLDAGTNELISAADLVISMSQSSTFIEGLMCDTPSIAFDETGRDWNPAVGQAESLVVDNATDMCDLALKILTDGVDPEAWRQIQSRVRWNYGVIDGMELDRIRRHILQACAVQRPEYAIEQVERVPDRDVVTSRK